MKDIKRVVAVLGSLTVLMATGIGAVSASAQEAGEESVTVSTAVKGTIVGDIDGDGEVTYKDAAYVIHFYGQEIIASAQKTIDGNNSESYNKLFGISKEQYEIVDFNKDGRVDSNDAIDILSYNIKSTAKSQNLDDELTARYVNVVNSSLSELLESKDFETAMKDIDNFKVFSIDDVSLGDTNQDGNIDSVDAVEILKSFAFSIVENKSTEVGNDIAEFNSDVNLDGKVNSSDAVEVLKTYADSMIKK
jgi:hypothetical protein